MCAPHNLMRRKPNCNININVAWPPGNFILNRMETFILARFNKSQCNELSFFQIFEDHFITGLSNFYLCILFSSYFSSAYNFVHNMLFSITFRKIFHCAEPILFYNQWSHLEIHPYRSTKINSYFKYLLITNPKLYVLHTFMNSLAFFQLKSSIGNNSICKQV